MKIRLPLLSLLLGLAIVPALSAQDGPKGSMKHDEPETELGKKMEDINGAWRKLRGQVSDASKNEDSLKQIAIIKAGLVEASKLEPARKADVPAADQAKFVADYQAKMKEFSGEVDKLEAMIKAGKNEDAAKQVQVLGDMQKDDHKSFKKQKKKM